MHNNNNNNDNKERIDGNTNTVTTTPTAISEQWRSDQTANSTTQVRKTEEI